MMVHDAISHLIVYVLNEGLIEPTDAIWAKNRIYEVLELEPIQDCMIANMRSCSDEAASFELHEILKTLIADAVSRGIIDDNQASRDLFDTKIMGALTPRPSMVIDRFWKEYGKSPSCATDWFYSFNFATNYIRSYRIDKDVRWQTSTPYGDLDITINLSKPEKDPKDIAKAGELPQTGYPACMLCPQNEGYAGRLDFPARQNLRMIPLSLDNEQWFMQYSPYVYYNEHCIVLNHEHVPMRIDSSTFRKLFAFLKLFPEYMIGSNADLPIVGGSILTHDHFQGGKYEFPMAKAPIEQEFEFFGFEDVEAGVVKWPMSVIRLRCANSERLVELGEKVLNCWRQYSDEEAQIFSETDGTPHNTITPIARYREQQYELDLVLRNNETTSEYPSGVFHPHQELHHIKKENIGLIEVMGLAVLPSRLKTELHELACALLDGSDISGYESIAKHAEWANGLKRKHDFDEDNVMSILKDEVGLVFLRVLEEAGVFKRNSFGQEHFRRFVTSVNNL